MFETSVNSYSIFIKNTLCGKLRFLNVYNFDITLARSVNISSFTEF